MAGGRAGGSCVAPAMAVPEDPITTKDQKIIRAKGGVREPAKQLGTSQACKMMSYRSRVTPEIEDTVVALAISQLAYGQVCVSNEQLKRGVTVSPFGGLSIWRRLDLATMTHRLKAFEAKTARRERFILAESQLAALEKAKAGKDRLGEFETRCPGLCGARTPSMRARRKAPAGSIGKPSSTPRKRPASLGSMIARRRSWLPVS